MQYGGETTSGRDVVEELHALVARNARGRK
jgi:hypothetical protein